MSENGRGNWIRTQPNLLVLVLKKKAMKTKKDVTDPADRVHLTKGKKALKYTLKTTHIFRSPKKSRRQHDDDGGGGDKKYVKLFKIQI
jgi:hypothetical protein